MCKNKLTTALLLVSLLLPAAASAEELSGIISPSFDKCVKKAGKDAKTSEEYKKSLLRCLDLEEKESEQKIQKDIHDYDNMSAIYKETVTEYYKTLRQYKKAGSDFIKSSEDPMRELKARFFEVVGAIGFMSASGYYTRTINGDRCNVMGANEEYVSGFDMCIEEVDKIEGLNPVEYRYRILDCKHAALDHWTSILQKNYDMRMNLYKDYPEKQAKLRDFQKAWKEYVSADSSYRIHISETKYSGIHADIEDTRDQARLLAPFGLPF